MCLTQPWKDWNAMSLKSSANACLSQFAKEEGFKLAAALDPRWKLAWCTPEEPSDLKQAVLQNAEAMSAFFPSFSTTSGQGSAALTD